MTEEITPTLAIGLGEAGCNMASTLHDIVKDEGIEEVEGEKVFNFVGIDTNNSDLRKNMRHRGSSNVTTIPLDTPEYFEDEVEDYDFINRDIISNERVLQDPGAKEMRASGRYYIDSIGNFRKVYDQLQEVIQDFVGTFEDTLKLDNEYMNLWIINSLGGGTGSGSFPIISGIIDDIRKYNLETWDSGSIRIYGLGAVPLSDGDKGSYANYRLNAYTALHDIKVLTGMDDDANREIEFGQERDMAKLNDREKFDLDNDGVFRKYFLHTINQEEMNDSGYVKQANMSAATLPIYMSLISGEEDWPKNITAGQQKPLYAFESVEVTAPMENMYLYYATQDRIDDLQDDIDTIGSKIDDHDDDIDYLEDVLKVDLDEYIKDYCEDKEELDEEDVELNEIINGFQDTMSDNTEVNSDMLDSAANNAIGTEYKTEEGEDLESKLDEAYNADWESETETSEVDNTDVFRHYAYQIASRNIKEELRDHDFTEKINEKWDDYSSELSSELSYLTGKDAEKKWEGGMRKFFSEKIKKKKRNIPTWSGVAGGVMFILAFGMLYAHVANLYGFAELGPAGLAVASISLTISQILFSIAFVISFILIGFYMYNRIGLYSLKKDKKECQELYAESVRLRKERESIDDRLRNLQLESTKEELEDRKSDLNSELEEKKNIQKKYKSIRDEATDKITDGPVDFDRKISMRAEVDEFTEPLKWSVKEYVEGTDLIDIESIGKTIKQKGEIDDDEGVIGEMDDVDKAGRNEEDMPDNLESLEDQDIIKESSIAEAMSEALGNRLNEVPIRDRTESQEDATSVEKILQYLWNSENSDVIRNSSGEVSYSDLISNVGYNTDQDNGEIEDPFRVWALGAYTDFTLENASEFMQVHEEYIEKGDRSVCKDFGLGDDGVYDNFVTKRFAYPEFYENQGHELNKEADVPSYFESD